MKTIWKYEFDANTLEMDKMIPERSTLLDVQLQRETICAWFVVETDNELVSLKLKAYLTGEYLPDDYGAYISTVQLGVFVLHVFDQSNI